MAAAAAAAPAGVRAGAGDGGEVFFFSARSPSPLLMAAAALAEAAGPGPSRPDPVPGGQIWTPGCRICLGGRRRLRRRRWWPGPMHALGAVLSSLPSLPSWPWLLWLRDWLCPGQRPLPASLPAAAGLAAKAKGVCNYGKTEASATAGGAGFGAWHPDSAAPGHGAEPNKVGHTGGDDGSDIGRCQSRRRWSNAASVCGGVARAAESSPALRGSVGGGWQPTQLCGCYVQPARRCPS